MLANHVGQHYFRDIFNKAIKGNPSIHSQKYGSIRPINIFDCLSCCEMCLANLMATKLNFANLRPKNPEKSRKGAF